MSDKYDVSLADLAGFAGRLFSDPLRRNTPGVIFLIGDLGAGKSTFAQAVIKELSPQVIFSGSPTFSLIHRYPLSGGGLVLHSDWYRIDSEADLEDSGVLEELSQAQIALVEWASKFSDSKEHLKKIFKRRRGWGMVVEISTPLPTDPLSRVFSIKDID